MQRNILQTHFAPKSFASVLLMPSAALCMLVFCQLACASEALMRAAIYEMTVKGDFRNGVEYMRRFIQTHRNEAHVHEWFAYGLSGLGLLEEALEHYRIAAKLRGGTSRLNAAWLPPNINFEMLRLLNAEHVEVSVGEGGCSAIFVANPCFTPLTDWRDPKFLERYNQMLLVYRNDDGVWRASFRIYFRTPMLSCKHFDWLNDARMVALAMSLVMCCSNLYVGMLPIELQPVSIWLNESGKPGVISESGHIYWCGVKPGRSLMQWFIEAAHEYGHHTFMAFGPFEGEHEVYSGGFMSERLNSIWLLELLLGSAVSVSRGADVGELRDGLREYVLSHFPDEMLSWSGWLRSATPTRAPKMNMRSFLGMVEFVERLYSSKALRAIFKQSVGEDAGAFLRGINAYVKGAIAEGEMRLPIRSAFLSDGGKESVAIAPLHEITLNLPAQLALPIWLPEGSFNCELLLMGGNVKPMVSVNGVPTAIMVKMNGDEVRIGFRVKVERDWWQMLSIELYGSGEVKACELIIGG